MRVILAVVSLACAAQCGAGEVPIAEAVARPARPPKSEPATQRATKPFDLSHIHSRFVAGFVMKPQQVLQSAFGRTAIATAFERRDDFTQSMKAFSHQVGMSPADVEQLAILFTERNIAAINRIEMPSPGMRPGQSNQKSRNNLKQLALAFHNFHDVYQRFPGFVKPGKGKLSWRVYILPYMDEIELYQKFDMDEDWDSENNKKLIAEMPDIFKTRGADEGETAIHITEQAFPVGDKVRFRDFVDGSSNTIMHIVAGSDTAQTWTKPGRLDIDEAAPWKAIGDVGNGFWVSMADGSVRKIDRDATSAERLYAMVTHAGGEQIQWSPQPARRAMPDQSPTFIVSATKPINQDHILKIAADSFGDSKKKRGNGHDYFDYDGYAIWFPTDRSLVATPTALLPGIMSRRKTDSTFRQVLQENKEADIIGLFDIKGMPVIHQIATAEWPAEVPASLKDIVDSQLKCASDF